MPKKQKNEVNIEDARILPNNLEAEQAVLCACLTDEDSMVNIVAKLNENDFYSQAHKSIFSCVVELFNLSRPVDIVTVADCLETKGLLQSIGGVSYLATLSNFLPSSAYYLSYVDIVKKNSVLRQLVTASNKIIENVYTHENEDALAFAEKTIFDIAEKGQPSTLENIGESLNAAMEDFEEIYKNGGAIQGVKTGFYQLDRLTNGLQKSDLIIIAARPSVGKTSFAMNIVTNAAIEAKAKVAVFSLEMSKEQLAKRMLCSVANVDMSKANHGELKESDWQKLWKASKKLSECKIYVDENTAIKPSEMLSKCRKLKREKGLDLVMVDYLQLMTGENVSKNADNRQNEVSDISRKMKILAKELKVPVILLSQMSRSIEKSGNRMPVLSDLRESGAIEQDADIVMFLHRPDEIQKEGADRPKDYIVKLIVAKHRNGELAKIDLGWIGSRVSFVNLNRDADAKSMEKSLESLVPPPPEPDEPVEVGDIDDITSIFDED